MKTLSRLSIATLIATLTPALLTGCATGPTVSGGPYPQSAIAFSPVTSAKDLVKWDGKFRRNLVSIDTYEMVAPAAQPLTEAEVSGLPAFTATMPPGTLFVESAGGMTQPYRVILHRPNQR